MDQKSPFAVQAAKASWIAPLLTILLGFAGQAISAGKANTPPETVRAVALAIGGISVIIVLAGLMLGILALFGIRKHGIKGILMPSIIGILLSCGWLYLLFTAIQAARHAAQVHAQSL
jgi:hypothetical protein